jgi:hypothetical protein
MPLATFSIATMPDTHVPPQRWWRVMVYETADGMRRAAHRYDSDTDFSGARGVVHHARWVNDDATGYRYSDNGYAGVIRLCVEYLNTRYIAHELVHAAAAVYRMNVDEDVYLGGEVGVEEEQLAHLYDELFTSFESRFPGRPAGHSHAAANGDDPPNS